MLQPHICLVQKVDLATAEVLESDRTWRRLSVGSRRRVQARETLAMVAKFLWHHCSLFGDRTVGTSIKLYYRRDVSIEIDHCLCSAEDRSDFSSPHNFASYERSRQRRQS